MQPPDTTCLSICMQITCHACQCLTTLTYCQLGDVNVLLTSSDTTNDDPGSMAAVSLPHLRMYTPYGFTTLKESPNTRRKESLLMNSSSLVDLKRLSSHRSIIRSSSGMKSLPLPFPNSPLFRHRMERACRCVSHI